MGRGRNSSLGAQREMDAEDSDDASTGADEHLTVGSELSARIDQLLQEQKSKKDDVRIVATRVADWLYVDSFTVAKKSRDEHKFAEALELFKVCAQLRPSTSGPAYEVAHAYAALGDKKRALAELKKAKSLGFTDTNRLNNEPEWQPLRAEPEFQRLADAIRAASDKAAKKPAGTMDQVVLGETRRPTGGSAETPLSPPQTTTTDQVVVTKTPYTAMSLPTAPSRVLHETKMPNHEMDDQTYLLPQQKVSAIFGDIDIFVLRDESGQGYIDGVVITHVKPGTRAEKIGLKSGMEITEIMGHPLRQKVSRADFNRIMEEQFDGYFFRLKVRDRLVVASKIEKDTPYLLLADLSPEQIERKYPAREITLQLR
jgi:tetratricopeptide (TPR) repeat protein